MPSKKKPAAGKTVLMKIEPGGIAEWKRKARDSGLTLEDWITAELNRAAQPNHGRSK